jgi:membrane-associated phospholipid phosphatase
MMRFSRCRIAAAALVVGLSPLACNRTPPADPKFVAEWMHTLYGAIRVERMSPPVASRLMSYAASALYAGLAGTDEKLEPLSGVLNGFPSLPRAGNVSSFDGTVAAVSAERVVLDSLLREALPTTRNAVARLADSIARARTSLGVSEPVRARSDSLGRKIGLAIVAWSRADGFDSTRGRPYVPPTGLGFWVNDAPGNTYASQNLSGASEFVALDNPANVLQSGNTSDRGLILSRPKQKGIKTLPAVNMAGTSEPYWGQVRPFVLKAWNECPVDEPPAYSPDTSSSRYQDARQVFDAKTKLTPEQRAIAFYWADNAGESGTPVGHWISIASQMVSERHLSAAEAARVMVLTSVAEADAFIASWGYKYQYTMIRPRTYIRRLIDSTWEPLIPTPPFPEYPSGHSTQSSAAAEVLTALVGDSPVEDSTSVSLGHSVRHFASFRAAAEEAGMSRIYGGIHFPTGNLGGRALGKCVGDKVVERFRAASAK